MAFNRPTLQQIIARVRADLESKLTEGSPVLRRATIYVFAVVIAGGMHLLYGAIEFFSRQIFGDTAIGDFLRRLASIFGVFPRAASYAQREVSFTGANGSEIPSETQLRRADGVLFRTTETATIADGSATVPIEALEAGTDGNTEAGIKLNLVSPITGVNSQATVLDTGVVDGADAETDESLRERFLDRVRQPPQGGALADYRRWAMEIAGVTRAWAYANHMGPGTVGVTFVRDGDESIIPDSGEVEEVQDYIDSIRPVTDEAFVFAPEADELDFTIELTPDTAQVRAAVEAELRDLIAREAEPGGTLLISHIREAISIAAGETDHILSSPSADVVSDPGKLIVMGSITWE